MPRPDKSIEIDRVLDSIIKHDTKTRARTRRVIPPELVEALDYYVRWELAPNRGRALIELALPMAREVVEKVREIGIKNIKERTKASDESVAARRGRRSSNRAGKPA